jgi:hypothetical protein
LGGGIHVKNINEQKIEEFLKMENPNHLVSIMYVKLTLYFVLSVSKKKIK